MTLSHLANHSVSVVAVAMEEASGLALPPENDDPATGHEDVASSDGGSKGGNDLEPLVEAAAKKKHYLIYLFKWWQTFAFCKQFYVHESSTIDKSHPYFDMFLSVTHDGR